MKKLSRDCVVPSFRLQRRDRLHLRAAQAVPRIGLDRNRIAVPGDDREERDEQEEI